MIYTVKYANSVLQKLQNFGFKESELIGSLGKGIESVNDIDILLSPKYAGTIFYAVLKEFLEPKKITNTDWGGWFFHDTVFGNIDFFFSTDNFDY